MTTVAPRPTAKDGSLIPLLATFFLGWLVFQMSASVLPPLYPAIELEFSLNGAQLGLISSALWLPYAALQIPMGVIGDRIGLRRILLATLTLATASLLLIAGAANSYGLLLLLMALQGIGLSAYYPAANGLTVTLVPSSWRGISSAVTVAGMPTGMILGLIAGPIIINAGLGWHFTFALLAVPVILLLLAIAITVPDVRAPAMTIRQVVATLRCRELLLVSAVHFCSTYGFWLILSWGPTFLFRERGFQLAEAGIAIAIIAAAALPAGLVAGHLSDRLGRQRLTMSLFVLSGLSLLAFAVVPSQLGLIIVLIAYGLFGKQALDPVVIAWTGDHVRSDGSLMMGAAMGAANLFRMIPAVIAPFVSGWLLDQTGSLVAAFVVGGIVIFIGIGFAAVAHDARPITTS